MDSSNSSCCNYNPISFMTTENDIHDSSSFINFPNSPQSTNHYDAAVYLYEQFCFSQYHQQPITITPENNHTDDIITATNTNTNIPPLIIPDSKPMKIQKSSKKDRHSKINTANGPRDRRMRLSLDVARKFFDLQDMLGFDKASRTVDWLLKNSWNAIKGLSDIKTNTTCAGSSISEEYNHCIEQQEVLSSLSKKNIVNNKIDKGKEITKTRVIVGKEARKCARERARNRTSQKRRLIITAQSPISCEGRRGNILGIVDRDEIVVDNIFYDSTAPWNGSNVTQENAAIFHSQHLAELQFCGKQWDAYETYNGSNFSG